MKTLLSYILSLPIILSLMLVSCTVNRYYYPVVKCEHKCEKIYLPYGGFGTPNALVPNELKPAMSYSILPYIKEKPTITGTLQVK